MYFIYLYQNRTMKPVEIILRRERRGGGRRIEVGESNQGMLLEHMEMSQ
jgi:hypothetical protein